MVLPVEVRVVTLQLVRAGEVVHVVLLSQARGGRQEEELDTRKRDHYTCREGGREEIGPDLDDRSVFLVVRPNICFNISRRGSKPVTSSKGLSP